MRLFSQFLLLGVLVVFGMGGVGRAQDNLYSNARGLVERTQNDMRNSRRANHDREKERERYANAEHSLSEFDKDLARNKFDKGKLDSAINDLKNVVENNTLDPHGRDILTQDLQDLRNLRQARGAGY